MTKRYPVRELGYTTFQVINAPQRYVNYDEVRVEVKLTPLRYGEDDRKHPVDSVHSLGYYIDIDGKDQRFLEHFARELLSRLMKEWNKCE